MEKFQICTKCVSDTTIKDIVFNAKGVCNFCKLHDIFEKFFNREVDLITENSLSNPYFIKKVNLTKTVLYEG